MEVGILEAKNRLSELVERAVCGEPVIITRRGEPMVTLVPARRRPSRAELQQVVDEVAAMRRTLPPYTEEEYRRDREEGRPE